MIFKKWIGVRWIKDSDLRDQVLSRHKEEKQKQAKELFMEVNDFSNVEKTVDPAGIKLYAVRKTVLDGLSRIKLKNEPNLMYLDQIPNCKRMYMLSPDEFIVMRKNGQDIHILRFLASPNEKGVYYQWNFTRIDIEENYISTSNDDFATESISLFLKLITFVELTEIDVIEIPGYSKFGTRNTGKIMNETDLKITIIDSRWNTVVIRTEGFDVSGHFSLRAVGKGRTEKKLIWINPYRKHGYIRNAKLNN